MPPSPIFFLARSRKVLISVRKGVCAVPLVDCFAIGSLLPCSSAAI